jgi:peptidoglycan-associated lipoprotein
MPMIQALIAIAPRRLRALRAVMVPLAASLLQIGASEPPASATVSFAASVIIGGLCNQESIVRFIPAFTLILPAFALMGCASQKTLEAQAESVSQQLDAQATSVSQQLDLLKRAQSSMADAQKNLAARLAKLESEQTLIATRLDQQGTASAALQGDIDSLRSQTSATQTEVTALTSQLGGQNAATQSELAALGSQVNNQGSAITEAQASANEALKIARDNQSASSEAARLTEETVNKQNSAIAQAQETANDAVKIASDSRLVSGKVVDSLLLTENMVSYSYEQPELTAQGRAALDTLIGFVKPKLPHVFVEIIGYSDSLSLDSQNRRIALERAESVRRYLHETGGIPLDRMSTISYGDLKPLASNTSYEGRAQNRRVLVQVLK